MYLYDSKIQKKVKLESIEPNKISIYSCGPTVYDDAHLGHARNNIVFDLLHKFLSHIGYEVRVIKNYTDIDDKIINKSKQNNTSIKEICNKYIKRYENDMNKLNISKDIQKPKATDFIPSMIDFVFNLLEQGKAYKTEKSIYFDSTSDDKYGSISKRLQDDGLSRIEVSDKKNAQDFVIWKFESDESISFDASFGRGRPGWHTECCSIINELEPNGVDIHCGGKDLLFPHHENEASQFRALRKFEIARYWIHNGFVNVDNTKMSKSLGNSFYLKDFLLDFHGEVIRYYLMAVHYRADFNFELRGIKEAKIFIDKIYRLKQKVYGVKHKQITKNFELIEDYLKDDLNISGALAEINKLINQYNEELSNNPKNKSNKQDILSFIVFLNNVLSLGLEDTYEYFRFGLSIDEIIEIDNLIKYRKKAREDKDFSKADEFKQELIDKNIKLIDLANGDTLWEKV